MSKKSGAELLRTACVRNNHHKLLERYLLYCHPRGVEESSSPRGGKRGLKSEERLFPNLAGFCRFLRMGTEDFAAVMKEYPTECAYIVTALEDEALNAAISPTLLNAYLKRWLGYERRDCREEAISPDGPPTICFEHDVYRDGG